ncbi:MAG: hypothetical protein LCH61_18515 [Proteobacteria bacterium]|nr:hypothetical protein [Pseudomonadota bacterium]
MTGTFAKLAGAALLAASFVATVPASAQGWGAPHGYRPPPARPHSYMPPRYDHGYRAPRHHWKWRNRHHGWYGPRYGW